jgi:hypothetical protein
MSKFSQIAFLFISFGLVACTSEEPTLSSIDESLLQELKSEFGYEVCETETGIALLRDKANNSVMSDIVYLRHTSQNKKVYTKLTPKNTTLGGVGYSAEPINSDVGGEVIVNLLSTLNEEGEIYLSTEKTTGSISKINEPCTFKGADAQYLTTGMVYSDWKIVKIEGVTYAYQEVHASHVGSHIKGYRGGVITGDNIAPYELKEYGYFWRSGKPNEYAIVFTGMTEATFLKELHQSWK